LPLFAMVQSNLSPMHKMVQGQVSLHQSLFDEG